MEPIFLGKVYPRTFFFLRIFTKDGFGLKEEIIPLFVTMGLSSMMWNERGI